METFSEVILVSLTITITFMYKEQRKPTNYRKLPAKFSKHTGANLLCGSESELPHLAALHGHLHPSKAGKGNAL